MFQSKLPARSLRGFLSKRAVLTGLSLVIVTGLSVAMFGPASAAEASIPKPDDKCFAAANKTSIDKMARAAFDAFQLRVLPKGETDNSKGQVLYNYNANDSSSQFIDKIKSADISKLVKPEEKLAVFFRPHDGKDKDGKADPKEPKCLGMYFGAATFNVKGVSSAEEIKPQIVGQQTIYSIREASVLQTATHTAVIDLPKCFSQVDISTGKQISSSSVRTNDMTKSLYKDRNGKDENGQYKPGTSAYEYTSSGKKYYFQRYLPDVTPEQGHLLAYAKVGPAKDSAAAKDCAGDDSTGTDRQNHKDGAGIFRTCAADQKSKWTVTFSNNSNAIRVYHISIDGKGFDTVNNDDSKVLADVQVHAKQQASREFLFSSIQGLKNKDEYTSSNAPKLNVRTFTQKEFDEAKGDQAKLLKKAVTVSTPAVNDCATAIKVSVAKPTEVCAGTASSDGTFRNVVTFTLKNSGAIEEKYVISSDGEQSVNVTAAKGTSEQPKSTRASIYVNKGAKVYLKNKAGVIVPFKDLADVEHDYYEAIKECNPTTTPEPEKPVTPYEPETPPVVTPPAPAAPVAEKPVSLGSPKPTEVKDEQIERLAETGSPNDRLMMIGWTLISIGIAMLGKARQMRMKGQQATYAMAPRPLSFLRRNNW